MREKMDGYPFTLFLIYSQEIGWSHLLKYGTIAILRKHALKSQNSGNECTSKVNSRSTKTSNRPNQQLIILPSTRFMTFVIADQ